MTCKGCPLYTFTQRYEMVTKSLGDPAVKTVLDICGECIDKEHEKLGKKG